MTSFYVINAPVPESTSVPIWKSVLELGAMFTRPVLLSDALCLFLELPVGIIIPRNDVTKHFLANVKKRGLLERTSIKKDDAISALFDLAPDDSLHILNLQKYLNAATKTVTTGVTNEEKFNSWWVEHGSPTVIAVDANKLPSWRLERLYKLLSAFPLTECAIYNSTPSVECDYCEGECMCVCEGEEDDKNSVVVSCGCSKIYRAVCGKHM